MTRDGLLKRIWIDSARCGGKPCRRGHRIWGSLILDLLASGSTFDEIWMIIQGSPGRTLRLALLTVPRWHGSATWTCLLRLAYEAEAR